MAARSEPDVPGHQHAASRHLSPEARHQYVGLLQAGEGERRAEQAYNAASTSLNAMLAEYDRLFEDPGPIGEAWEKPWLL